MRSHYQVVIIGGGVNGLGTAYALAKAGGADHCDFLLAADAKPQQRVEADEMVHVGMADEDVADPQQVAGAERRQVAEVEQDRPAPVQHLDEQRRIAEAAVDQARVEVGPHARPTHKCRICRTRLLWAPRISIHSDPMTC